MINVRSLPSYRRDSQWHPVNPAQCPVGVARTSIPRGWPPSLHPLRGRQHRTTWVEPIADTVVRGLRGYYGAIRLPAFVHHRRASLDFPMRPAQSPGSGERGISRFSREVFPYMPGVSDRAGLRRISRYRCDRCGLPLLLTASAPQRKLLSRLNARPARTPVNASPLPLRATTHDSGPLWAANPSTYDSFIHNTSPVYPGAQGEPDG
jgi:hypothetical protein